MSKKGFTLIELLVVISIIGILAALATVSFSSTQKQARDVQRKSDLKQYQNALESYANKNNGLYPAWGNTKVQVSGDQFCDNLAGILDVCPDDPKSSTGIYYYYRSDGNSSGSATATKYILWGRLENTSEIVYWVVCSNGLTGETKTNPDSAGVCPTLTN